MALGFLQRKPDSGLGNIRSRVEKLNGELSIENNGGAHISITIPFSELQVLEFDKKLSKWQSFIMGVGKKSCFIAAELLSARHLQFYSDQPAV